MELQRKSAENNERMRRIMERLQYVDEGFLASIDPKYAMLA